MDNLPSSVGPASWEAAALIMVRGSWLLSATPRSLLQSLLGGRAVGGQFFPCFLVLILVVLWALPQIEAASSPASWDRGHL